MSSNPESRLHADRLKQEQTWYEDAFNANHLLNRYPLYSRMRNKLSYDIAHFNLAARLAQVKPSASEVLVAPCGRGFDYFDLHDIWPRATIRGIDIAEDAVRQCSNATVGDILQMPFNDESFDAVVSTLFFHHVADEGYSAYLREIRRVLRPGGIMATMEPSNLHPLFAITRPAKKAVGNITGQVEHEHPIDIRELERACKANGFSQVESFACSFGHNRMPIPITAMINILSKLPTLRYFAWQVGVIATK